MYYLTEFDLYIDTVLIVSMFSARILLFMRLMGEAEMSKEA